MMKCKTTSLKVGDKVASGELIMEVGAAINRMGKRQCRVRLWNEKKQRERVAWWGAHSSIIMDASSYGVGGIGVVLE